MLARPYEGKRPPSKLVAVVVPLSNRPDLLPDEVVSLRHLRHFLESYDKYLLAPPEMRMRIEGFQSKRYPARFFGTVAAHNRLLGTPDFYKGFTDYEYIFFYHLDSLAFSDQLTEWCKAGWDYIGSPFINCEDTPWVKDQRVGNGGFALLRVESALKVLYNRYRQHPSTYWLDYFTRNGPRMLPLIGRMERLQARFPRAPLIKRFLDEWQLTEDPNQSNRNNDIFWSDKARQYLPQFKVATFEEGLRFAFEAAPRKCFAINGGRLPFGCHAWGRYDREFWESFLIPANEGESGTGTMPA